MHEFTIKGIALEEESQLPIVILHNKEKNLLLPIHVGPFEASAIIVEMEGVRPPRPLTHDLLAQLFQKHRLRLLYVEIYGRLEDRHLARINYRSVFSRHSMEVRPSDGLALAIRLRAPIRVAENIVDSLPSSQNLIKNQQISACDILYLETENPRITLM